jgi:hypothetical protein
MNKERRAKIREVIDILSQFDSAQIEDAISAADAAREEEQDYYDAMPESFQSGEKGELAQQAISYLEAAVSALENVRDSLEEADTALNDALI